jgi:hypothetical protein
MQDITCTGMLHPKTDLARSDTARLYLDAHSISDTWLCEQTAVGHPTKEHELAVQCDCCVAAARSNWLWRSTILAISVPVQQTAVSCWHS